MDCIVHGVTKSWTKLSLSLCKHEIEEKLCLDYQHIVERGRKQFWHQRLHLVLGLQLDELSQLLEFFGCQFPKM